MCCILLGWIAWFVILLLSWHGTLDWVKKGKCCTKSDFSCFSHKKFLKAPLTTFFEASIMSIRYFKKFFEASPIDIKCIDSGSVVWKFYVRECFFCSVTFGWLNAVFGVWAKHRPPSERMCFHRASRLCQKECCCLPATHICATIVLFFLAQLKDHGELYIENIKSFVWLLLNYNL